ncbi:hypothetical protein CHS0354_035619 [Potamilus streckersoni]|uniref:B box-type domain-containing protein n=1 Tax=Potamilus streckersoni TaxID=2493646 RepID=A0AAE0RRY6_9BIVA|nr:hypothetical protein CHS0354_035619 [Potamilus streckersoni]
MEPVLTDGSECSSKTLGTKGEVENEFMCSICSVITNTPKEGKHAGVWASFYSEKAISGTIGSKVKVERSCDGCLYTGQPNTAQWLCVVCEEGLCNICLTAHKKTKVTRDHKVISTEELIRTQENQIKFTEGFGCPYHEDRPMEYYCQSHEAVCCTHCFYSDHRTCAQKQDSSKYLSSSSNIRSQEIIEQLMKLEKHLQTFTLTNESNIGKLEATVINVVAEIWTIRKKVNEMLDQMEKMVKTEGDRIYKEEMVRRQEENRQCQNLINAVRKSHTFLESVLKYGTDSQKFLASKKSIHQMKCYTDQIREKYEEIKFLTVHLELGGFVKEILSPDICNLAKLQTKECRKSFLCSGIIESLHHSGTGKSPRKHQLKLASVVDIHCPGKVSPYYLGGVQLPGGDIVLVDYSNKIFCLYDSSYNFITSSKLPSEPRNMCLLDDHEVAVTLCYTKTLIRVCKRQIDQGYRSNKDNV